ncbi:hypothetical protein HBF26_12085 [Luteibacter jiangsuensis]|uniref:Lecithin:cholesterol acyltransferase n=1 Tax=Luteibacter jiangsuensis TaxID=637577 RepID=A0ABX0Q6Q2_9GAMM|nr:hypothetical protein [Luteibacter jiangsuensis]
MTQAVVFVPGIMGSELKRGDEVIWPGSPLELWLPYAHMAELLDPATEVGDIIRNVSISEQYGALVRSLESWGYVEKGITPTLVVVPYDWRKDNKLAARKLADEIDALAAKLGADTDISIVAHSMGGLISRCYLESGDYKARPGLASVKRLITLATPHRGAPMALSAAIGNERRVFLNAQQVKSLASDPNFPSLYQLLPPKGEPCVWDRSSGSRYAPLDIYDIDVARSLDLVPENLASACSFQETLDLDRRPSHVRYFFFVGSHETTTSSVMARLDATDIGHRIAKVDRENAGDGTVPIWSAMLTGIQTEQVGGEHAGIYKNQTLIDVLGTLLGGPALLAARGQKPELWVRHQVFDLGRDVELTLELPNGTTEIDGELRVMRHAKDTFDLVRAISIQYAGPAVDHLALILPALDFPGAYQIVYIDKGEPQSAATEFFVQPG